MSKRSYEQYCPLARSLDLLGERWTMLIVRDLVPGPKRYKDLRHGLPGIATDILTRRLRDLERAGVVRKRELAPPASVSVYELTERGRELEPALISLSRFGLGQLDTPPPDMEPPSEERFGLLLRVLFDPGDAPAKPETVAIEGERDIGVSFSRAGFEVHAEGEPLPREPAATLSADAPTLYELMTGRLDALDAIAQGRLEVDGDLAAVGRMRAAFPVPAGAVAA